MVAPTTRPSAPANAPVSAAPAPLPALVDKPRKLESTSFYSDVLKLLKKTKIPFLVGGTCAVNAYVGTNRDTKDLDIFCRAGDYMRILDAAKSAGYRTEIEDERWIGKIKKGKHYCDVIFSSANMAAPIHDAWFDESHEADVLGVSVKLLPPTELVWSKVFVQDRHKYDGNDVAHLLLRTHERIDWKRLLSYMEPHWEVLLMHVLRFRYIYPSEREIVPRWLLDELLARLNAQLRMPTPQKKPCRGRLFSRADFLIDVTDWGYADVGGGDDRFSG